MKTSLVLMLFLFLGLQRGQAVCTSSTMAVLSAGHMAMASSFERFSTRYGEAQRIANINIDYEKGPFSFAAGRVGVFVHSKEGELQALEISGRAKIPVVSFPIQKTVNYSDLQSGRGLSYTIPGQASPVASFIPGKNFGRQGGDLVITVRSEEGETIELPLRIQKIGENFVLMKRGPHQFRNVESVSITATGLSLEGLSVRRVSL